MRLNVAEKWAQSMANKYGVPFRVVLFTAVDGKAHYFALPFKHQPMKWAMPAPLAAEAKPPCAK